MASETTSLRLDPEVKKQAYALFKQMGIKPAQAFNLFLYQVVLNRGMPFELRVPNEETLAAMQETQQRDKLPAYRDARTMVSDLLSDDNK